jgi:hypothetical protein
MYSFLKRLPFLCVLIAASCAVTDPDMRDRFDEAERFEVFRDYLIKAGQEMDVVLKDGKKGAKGIMSPVRDETLSFADPLEVVELPSFTADGVEPVKQYAIRIAPDFLRRATNAYLQFGAAHEMCHLKLRHIRPKERRAAAQERDANACACEYVGRTRCVDVHRYLARFLGIQRLTTLTDEEMVRHVRGLYGIAEFPRP